MQDPELLELTCSEPLSLNEEQANQASWHTDEGKLTFIICAAPPGQPFNDLTQGMAGDVNAFFTAWDAESDQPAEQAHAAEAPLLAEVELMVAEPSQRRRGLGKQAMLLFMQYVAERVPRVCAFCAKIGEDNAPSLRLFEALGFREHKRLTVFQQVELRLSLDAGVRARLHEGYVALGASEQPLAEAQAATKAAAEPDVVFASPFASLSLTEHPPPFGVGAAAPDDGEEQEQEPILHTLAQSDRQKAEDRLDRSHGLGYAHVHGQYQ